MTQAPGKRCATCGREIEWRKKWARDWENVRYCSRACRGGVSDQDRALEQAILSLLERRARGATICPSEAARRIDAARMPALMEPTRRAARRLEARGLIDITQKGRVVNPSTARGPIRLRRRTTTT